MKSISRKTVIIIGVLIVALIILAINNISLASEMVSVELAKKVAMQEIIRGAQTLFHEWENATIFPESPIIFFDLSDSPFAYTFLISQDRIHGGYRTGALF